MAEHIRKVHKIESTASLLAAAPTMQPRKRRVAAYARVSTDSDEQLSSYEAQVDNYTKKIRENPTWEFVAVYADEGVTGTNTKKREGFNRMIEDALAGKIDLILTKSISRFARNTVDALTTIRSLKEKGVEVYFEKENIYTLDAKGEVMLTIMSSLAQEESRSISENVTWGKRKSMADGKVSLAYSHFLGYEKGPDGILQIVEEEAKVVRKIYSLFLSGRTVRSIADQLTHEGILTPSGKTKWSVSTIMSILQNEKYNGDALLQKTYTVDFLSKTVKKNNGEIMQYYIQDSHPAIIDPDTFELVQNEIKRRRSNRRHLHRNSPFTAKIICSECGAYYGRKVWHSGTKYRSYIWRCNRKYDCDKPCGTPNLREDEIELAFVTAFNQLLGDKERYIVRFEELLPLLADASSMEDQRNTLEKQHAEMMKNLCLYMEANTRQVQNQAEYNQRFSEMQRECRNIEDKIAQVKKEILTQQGRKEQIRRCLDELRRCGDILDEFDLDLWNAVMESVMVSADGTLTFLFHDGTEVPVRIPKTK